MCFDIGVQNEIGIAELCRSHSSPCNVLRILSTSNKIMETAAEAVETEV